MSLEVVTPDEHVGEVLGDLHARRGKVAGITARPGVQTVACFVPMASMFGYATDLRSRTKGRATYAMELRPLRRSTQPAPRRRDVSTRASTPEARPSRRTFRVEREIRPQQAPRQHRHDRSRRPRQDHVDRRDHEGPVDRRASRSSRRSIRSTRRRKRRRAASRSRRRTSSTRATSATTRTSIARATPTTSRT